jgi:hypothetical protein
MPSLDGSSLEGACAAVARRRRYAARRQLPSVSDEYLPKGSHGLAGLADTLGQRLLALPAGEAT